MTPTWLGLFFIYFFYHLVSIPHNKTTVQLGVLTNFSVVKIKTEGNTSSSQLDLLDRLFHVFCIMILWSNELEHPLRCDSLTALFLV